MSSGVNEVKAQVEINPTQWQRTDDLPNIKNPTGDVYQLEVIKPGKDHVLSVSGSGDMDNTYWYNRKHTGYTKMMQQWLILPTGDQPVWLDGTSYEQYYIINQYTGKPLNMSGYDDLDPVVNMYFDAKKGQKWLFIPNSSKGFTIKNSYWNKAFSGAKHLSNGNFGNVTYTYAANSPSLSNIVLWKAKGYNMRTPSINAETSNKKPNLEITWSNGNPVYPKTDKPFASEFEYLPAFIIKDNGLTNTEKIKYSPFYKLIKESYILEIDKSDNSGNNNEIEIKYYYSSGITESESNSRTESFSVSVTGGTGEASPVKFEMSAEFGMAWTNEKSTGTEKISGKETTVLVSPGYATGLYSTKYKFTLKRLDETSIKSWEVYGPDNKTIISSMKPKQ
ncbi:hypothetical protein [Lacinutrix sp. Bg11-31]|uniref:hypothetical protein n=1 Tax=Lacinutrix sp. Bg11-31 TaxID=2057808 RepID=UPI000C319DF5|nr:hypothetical protein [Lacinutrix sp. Bg11-31]AUC82022.1 hypothetical protein CW733_07740 [Lacinutrix sp. Bg11-31]